MFTSGGFRTDTHQGDTLTLQPGDFALVQTFERLAIPPTMRGRIGLRSRYSLSGLINLSGPQIDLGFPRHLTLGLVNIGPGPRTIADCDRIFTVEFDNVGDAVSQPCAGGITAFLIEYVTHGEGFSYPHLAATRTRLEQRIEAINKSLSYLFFPVLVGVVVALITPFVK